MSGPVRVSLISLGCPKNLVDSEVLLGHAARSGILVAQRVEDADVAVVNTCGFIDSAKEESIETVLEVTRLKESGQLKGVIVVGCLSQRYGEELRQQMPEVDAILGLSDYTRVPDLIRHLARGGDARFRNDTRGANLKGQANLKGGPSLTVGGDQKGARSDLQRLVLTPRSYAYLRIGEGCDHTCTFCAIPAIRGKQRSKPIEVLVEEATGLAKGGVKELVLVAEDSTAYGTDWQPRQRALADLLMALSEVPGIEWIRVLYAYPHTVSERVTEQLRDNPKVVPYLDIPIQHISTRMLQAMKRGVSQDQVRRILDRLRQEVPGIAVRTTYILGFPGETDADFDELLALTRDYKFERLGVFPYSREEGTPAAGLDDEVPRETAEERIAAIMDLSRQNIEARNASLVGQEMQVLVDGRLPPDHELSGGHFRSVGRTFADAPDIDCSVFFGQDLPSGRMVRARIEGVAGYDLVARSTQ